MSEPASRSHDDLDSLVVKGIVLTMKDDEQEQGDEMRPEYDFSKLKLVGRGIYAERYRAGVEFIIRNDRDRLNENENDTDDDKGGNAESVR